MKFGIDSRETFEHGVQMWLRDVTCSVCQQPLDHRLADVGHHLPSEPYLCRPTAVTL